MKYHFGFFTLGAALILPNAGLANSSYSDPHRITPSSSSGDTFTVEADASNGYHVKLDHSTVDVTVQFEGVCSGSASIVDPSTPSGISIPENLVQRYFEIDFICSATIANGYIDFSVPKSWLSTENLTASNVALQHYNDTDEQWEVLATSIISEDSIQVNYRAQTDSFSPFAVTGDENLTAPTGDNVFIVLGSATLALVLGGAFMWQVLRKGEEEAGQA